MMKSLNVLGFLREVPAKMMNEKIKIVWKVLGPSSCFFQDVVNDVDLWPYKPFLIEMKVLKISLSSCLKSD